jgi:hypothetical protein
VSNAVDMTRRLLRGSDPVPVETTTGTADDPIGRATLTRILAIPRYQPTPGLRPRRGWRLAAVVATGAAVLLAAAFILVPHGGSGSAYAATPPLLQYQTTGAAPTGQELLRQLAVLAERQLLKPAGRYDYVKTRGWYLDIRVAGGSTSGQLDPTFRQQWIAPDGSGRLEETRGDSTTLNDNFAAGGLAGPQEWPTDPAALRAELAKSHPNYGTFEWFTAVGDVWNVQVVSPRLQAGLLRMLADERQLTNAGTVTDRIGRTGVAVSTESSNSGLNTRYTLIFDPKTGMLLDFEQVLLEAGKLPVKVPATSSYTVWITTGHVNSIGHLPHPS